MGLFHHVLVYMGDLQLVHTELNLSTLDAGILTMMRQVSFMMFSLNMVDYPKSFLLLSTVVLSWKSNRVGLVGGP